MLEKLMVVACGGTPFYQSKYQPVLEKCREKKRRQANLRSEGADNGKWRTGVDGEQSVDMDMEVVVSPVKDKSLMALRLVRTQMVPQILWIQMLQIQILVSIPTPALIQPDTDEHPHGCAAVHCIACHLGPTPRRRAPIV